MLAAGEGEDPGGYLPSDALEGKGTCWSTVKHYYYCQGQQRYGPGVPVPEALFLGLIIHVLDYHPAQAAMQQFHLRRNNEFRDDFPSKTTLVVSLIR